MAAPRAHARSETLREEIVRHATRLIAERGFEATSVADVAAAAKVSKQSLLYHFKSKDALKDAVLDRLLDHANRAMVGMIGQLTSDESRRLDQLLSSAQGFFDAEPHAARVFLRLILDEDAHAIDRIREGTRGWFRFMAEEVARGQKFGRIRPELDPEAAVVQVGMLVVTNFALLPLHGWTKGGAGAWQKRRLTELFRAMRAILFPDAQGRVARK